MGKIANEPPYIAVVKFKGKSGGFATSETTRYRTELVGLDGSLIPLSCDSWGFAEQRYAHQVANRYAAASGFEVVSITETKQVSTATVRNFT